MDLPGDQRQKFIRDNIDRVISPDGRTGRLRQLIESGYPVTLLTHWQSLYTQGTELGLEGLKALLERIQKECGNSLEWVTCSERMRHYASSMKVGA
jgi:predicted house-cleaning noncanonical NTP pyrophosphatase (MazG superfamily)